MEKNYGERIKQEENFFESFKGEPALLYTGVSCQGLPMVSKLFAINLFDIGEEFEEEELNAKIELLETTISGQLATISMNSFIRAKSLVKEIQIILDEEENHFGFISFEPMGVNNLYTLELFTMGQPPSHEEFINKVKNTSENTFQCLQNPFCGELKPYANLKGFLSKLDFS
ncbi:MAG: hypothetical protein GF364_04430 [Candidatus Lokiarchaeota archaeon]|nr:hypothetical protein [Candidatus Lokiarchaeota archaeon]